MTQEVRKALDHLMDICTSEGLPLFATIAEEVNGKTVYESRVQTPLRCKYPLSNDKITKFNAALNDNFNLVLRGERDTAPSEIDVIGDLLAEN